MKFAKTVSISICHSVYGGGGVPIPLHHVNTHLSGRQSPRQIPETATEAGGKHPTGMHSCLSMQIVWWETQINDYNEIDTGSNSNSSKKLVFELR